MNSQSRMSEEFLREIAEDDLNPKKKKRSPEDGLFERNEVDETTERKTLQE